MFEPHKASIYKWVKHFVKPHDNGPRTWQQASSNCKYTYTADQMKRTARYQLIYALRNETGVHYRVLFVARSLKFYTCVCWTKELERDKMAINTFVWIFTDWKQKLHIFSWHIPQCRLINHTALHTFISARWFPSLKKRVSNAGLLFYFICVLFYFHLLPQIWSLWNFALI